MIYTFILYIRTGRDRRKLGKIGKSQVSLVENLVVQVVHKEVDGLTVLNEKKTDF